MAVESVLPLVADYLRVTNDDMQSPTTSAFSQQRVAEYHKVFTGDEFVAQVRAFAAKCHLYNTDCGQEQHRQSTDGVHDRALGTQPISRRLCTASASVVRDRHPIGQCQ